MFPDATIIQNISRLDAVYAEQQSLYFNQDSKSDLVDTIRKSYGFTISLGALVKLGFQTESASQISIYPPSPSIQQPKEEIDLSQVDLPSDVEEKLQELAAKYDPESEINLITEEYLKWLETEHPQPKGDKLPAAEIARFHEMSTLAKAIQKSLPVLICEIEEPEDTEMTGFILLSLTLEDIQREDYVINFQDKTKTRLANLMEIAGEIEFSFSPDERWLYMGFYLFEG